MTLNPLSGARNVAYSRRNGGLIKHHLHDTMDQRRSDGATLIGSVASTQLTSPLDPHSHLHSHLCSHSHLCLGLGSHLRSGLIPQKPLYIRSPPSPTVTPRAEALRYRVT